jgi:hypothetical protein
MRLCNKKDQYWLTALMLDPNLNAAAKNAAITRINKIFDQDMNNIATVFGAEYTDTTV